MESDARRWIADTANSKITLLIDTWESLLEVFEESMGEMPAAELEEYEEAQQEQHGYPSQFPHVYAVVKKIERLEHGRRHLVDQIVRSLLDRVLIDLHNSGATRMEELGRDRLENYRSRIYRAIEAYLAE
jgi:hypothetical protein